MPWGGECPRYDSADCRSPFGSVGRLHPVCSRRVGPRSVSSRTISERCEGRSFHVLHCSVTRVVAASGVQPGSDSACISRSRVVQRCVPIPVGNRDPVSCGQSLGRAVSVQFRLPAAEAALAPIRYRLLLPSACSDVASLLTSAASGRACRWVAAPPGAFRGDFRSVVAAKRDFCSSPSCERLSNPSSSRVASAWIDASRR